MGMNVKKGQAKEAYGKGHLDDIDGDGDSDLVEGSKNSNSLFSKTYLKISRLVWSKTQIQCFPRIKLTNSALLSHLSLPSPIPDSPSYGKRHPQGRSHEVLMPW